ncbi:patatin-like phospholipase family protein [Occallatibacter riparius]|uniref:Patatin-like phospholipase family protein n=1 Tax=Occallatibacter riparius TaxID=1002689 RepID=A0A9J7BQV7_9BACT|nr:patatin-like phospholipase family protein [Occallatibacter riparius]UWZ85260.1 patatin-like phospholipase family protein [Occallatibacter riparius]
MNFSTLGPNLMVDYTVDRTSGSSTLQSVRIGIAMSGGGFRAAVFHLGVLRRIAELGWLPHLDIMSTVSGGSVIGAFAASRWSSVARDGGDWSALERHVVRPFIELITTRDFIREWAWSLPWLPFRKLLDATFTRTKLAGLLFGDVFCNGLRCSELPERPYLVLNSTSLVSIRSWRFTRDGMGDSRIGLASWGSKPLSLGEAVAASAAFPPIFPPARIRRSDYTFSPPVYGEDSVPNYPLIPVTDGGVYDNLGVEAIGKQTILPGIGRVAAPEFLIVSDAGYPAQYKFRSNGIPVLASALLLYRVNGIAQEQAAAQRRRALVADFSNPSTSRKGLLVMLGSGIQRIPNGRGKEYEDAVGSQYMIPPIVAGGIRRIRTNLDRFDPLECEALMYHAYVMTDAFLWAHRLTCPERYRVPNIPDPIWRIEFTDQRIREWQNVLVRGNGARMEERRIAKAPSSPKSV